MSLDSSHCSSLSGSSEESGVTGVSMENQVSCDGGCGSPRGLSSASEECRGSEEGEGEGLRLRESEEEEEGDLLGVFPLTRPGRPVRTNTLSLWTTLR